MTERRVTINKIPRGVRRQASRPTGKASTPEGQATVNRILDSAREILIDANAGGFSMRNIANRAGLRLNNVQYYFKTRDELVHALMVNTGERYQKAFDELLEGIEKDPRKQFQAVIRFNLEDGFGNDTRALFIYFWALLNELDQNTGRLIGDLYAIYFEQLTRALKAICPQATVEEIARRVKLVAAVTEGLMIVRGPSSTRSREARRLIDEAVNLASRIAEGIASSDSR